MTDISSRLGALRRPALLIRAARHGIADYDRTRDLARIIRDAEGGREAAAGLSPERALPRLIDHEALLDARRRAGDAGYSIARHVEVLVAVMAEARLLPRRTGTA